MRECRAGHDLFARCDASVKASVEKLKAFRSARTSPAFRGRREHPRRHSEMSSCRNSSRPFRSRGCVDHEHRWTDRRAPRCRTTWDVMGKSVEPVVAKRSRTHARASCPVCENGNGDASSALPSMAVKASGSVRWCCRTVCARQSPDIFRTLADEVAERRTSPVNTVLPGLYRKPIVSSDSPMLPPSGATVARKRIDVYDAIPAQSNTGRTSRSS